MRGGSVLGSLAFALVAALGSIPWILVGEPFVGRLWAAALYCLVTLVLYLFVIAPSVARGFAIAGLAAVAAGVVGLLASWPAEAILGAVVILAVARSGFLYRRVPARALVSEVLLSLGGLLFARAVGGPTVLGIGLAIWSFFLVQSLYFLIGGRSEVTEEPAVDPFERARQQALVLMDSPRGDLDHRSQPS